MLIKTCNQCGQTKQSRWHRGQICSTCYMKNRELTCIICKCTKSHKWYKGPICNDCYCKQGCARRAFKPHEPCIRCERTISSNWHKGVCQSCHQKEYRSNPLNIERLYKTFLTYTRNRKKECDITLEQYTEIHNKPCYYCGQTIPHQFGGMDRINNELGYTKDNVLPCCGTCNKIRGTFLTVDEMKYVMEKLIEYRKNKK